MGGKPGVIESVARLLVLAALAIVPACGTDGEGSPYLPDAGGDVSSCQPACAGKECGDDGCGGQCGHCPAAAPFCVNSTCQTECNPACAGKECGPDGCGGSCGTCPQAAPYCVQQMCQVACEPNCQFSECGDDGCGGSCGECGCGEACLAGQCVFQACAGKECGDDGCGGNCGGCDDTLACTLDQCIANHCVHQPEGDSCVIDAACFGLGKPSPANPCLACDPALSQSTWSPRPTGTICAEGQVCFQSACCNHAGNCAGKECGDDACGSSCGTCAEDGLDCTSTVCADGQCMQELGSVSCLLEGQCLASGTLNPDEPCLKCDPSRSGTTWTNLADGTPCPGGDEFECVSGSCQCIPDCASIECDDDGCGGSCGKCDDNLACTIDACKAGQCTHTTADDTCLIGDQCVPAGTEKPGNPCMACQPDESQTGWAALPETTPCPGGVQNGCKFGECVCLPACNDKECGPDGCGAECGQCDPGEGCASGQCFGPTVEWKTEHCCMQQGFVKVAPDHQTTIGGIFKQTIQFQNAVLNGPPGSCGNNTCTDAYLVSLNADGLFEWGKTFGSIAGFGKGYDDIWAVALGPDGDATIAGAFGYEIDFGAGPIAAGQNGNGFIAKFEEGGEHIWSKKIGQNQAVVLLDIGLDGSGNSYAVGATDFTGKCGGSILSQCMSILIAKFSPEGETIWSRDFGPQQGGAYAHAIGVDTDGNLAVTGFYQTLQLDLDGLVLEKDDAKDHRFVAYFDTLGNAVWALDLGEVSYTGAQSSLVLDSGGNAIMLSYHSWGGGPMRLQKWSSVGVQVWMEMLLPSSSAAKAHPTGMLRTDVQGNIYVTGDVGDGVDLGGGLLSKQVLKEVFVAKFDVQGQHVWSKALGGQYDVTARSLDVHDDGSVYVLSSRYLWKLTQL